MFEELKRTLHEEEIECRIGTFKKGKGYSLLLYKTARTDAKILDEWAAATGGLWNCYFKMDANNNVICTITLEGEFGKISREDVGFNDREGDIGIKGAYSDAFKRAGFKYGIGVELYDVPFIWIIYNNDYPPSTFNYKIKFLGETLQDGFKILDKELEIYSTSQPKQEKKDNTKFVQACMDLGYSINELNDIVKPKGFLSITQIVNRDLQIKIYEDLKAWKDEKDL
ncbi:MAG: Rad52/Rad22 family DNA repair protein [Candidatus Paceibacterota bacterium]